MNINGGSILNQHDGDTLIEGDLTVDGQIFVGDAEGKSEYLDSGVYMPTISTITTNWSFNLVTDGSSHPIYEKNGNVVTLAFNLLVGWLTATTTFASFAVTVPSLDLFDQKVTNKAWASAGLY